MIITFENKKGGSCKTQNCLWLGLTLNQTFNKRVLFVDLDESNTLSRYFLDEETNESILNVLNSTSTVENNIISFGKTLGLLKVPADYDLDIYLRQKEAKRDSQIKKILEPVKNKWDYILIDSRPLKSETVTNAVEAADIVVIPIQPELSCLDLTIATKMLTDDLDKPAYILRSMWPGGKSILRDTIDEQLKQLDLNVLKTTIRKSTEIQKNYSFKENLLDRKSPVKEDYENLAKEIIKIKGGK